jgi:hypothetical protein
VAVVFKVTKRIPTNFLGFRFPRGQPCSKQACLSCVITLECVHLHFIACAVYALENCYAQGLVQDHGPRQLTVHMGLALLLMHDTQWLFVCCCLTAELRVSVPWCGLQRPSGGPCSQQRTWKRRTSTR